ncbi:amino acid ABC transporter permease [Aeromonas sp. L_1B5_3]|uniref:amino acid ABC transporter permease n=1 Tax=Aeromonas sp. L_1B5_3 TaxID=1588629 RepID=UPI0005B6BA05|nr:amino acid ABC transporter permease [Aeromonas sp. L_1B5_3]KIQ79064.1 amino acid ABC transporter permease [Aeromonas sp. L_1B5_3]
MQRLISRTLKRFSWLDGVIVLLLALAGLWLASRIHIGVAYEWHWHDAFAQLFTHGPRGETPYFFSGLLTTLRIALLGMVLALLLGTALGVAAFSRRPFLVLPATLFIQLIRNLPPLVFIFIFYFFIANQLLPASGLSSWLGNISIPTWLEVLFGPPARWENLISGTLCVGMISAAFVAEIVRAGLAAIPQGQWEAAHSLGLSPWVRLRHVILPQAMLLMLPPLTGQLIALVKDTAIVSLISVQELTFVGTEMANSSGLVYEIWLLVAAAYLLICLSLFILLSRLEVRQGARKC